MQQPEEWKERLGRGLVIPACPLALTGQRRLDERRQRALVRYYMAAGAGGLAAGVHTTQFAIRQPQHALLQPVLELVALEMKRCQPDAVRIGGICGQTPQALREAQLLRDFDYHAGLLSLAALSSASSAELVEHCRQVAEVLPIVGFYLQPAVGGRVLPYEFWRDMLEIENVVAIKIAPFNRYQTIDVVRAVIDADRNDVALYTGNDDNILIDLLTPFAMPHHGSMHHRRIVGGLLGQWAVWTHRAVELWQRCRAASTQAAVDSDLLVLGGQLTDANAALFDAAHGFRGCIAGIHEVLRRQGLLQGIWCLDPDESLSPGQSAQIDRVLSAYPHLTDDAFVEEHRDSWLS